MAEILIAGAGVGGLTAAIALARIGASVTVLERAPQLRQIGAGVQLSPNANRILARLGLFDAIAARAVEPTGVRVRSARSAGQIVFMPLADARERWGAPYLVVHRADLQEVLCTAIAAEPSVVLHLDATLAGFGTVKGGVKASIKQAGVIRTFTGDALIGADGVRSAVRAKLVDREDAPTQTGRTAWRALVDVEAVDPMFRAPETGLWLGRDAHLVHYPLQNRRRINVVAITQDNAQIVDGDLWACPGDPEVVRKRFHTWHPKAQGLIAAAETWTAWPLFDRAALATWSAGPIALLGDAAHPILPFFAQGAAQAIEDSAALAAAVSATRDLPDALASYSTARRSRAARVQETSRRLGRLYHLAGPPAAARNVSMRLLGGRRLLSRYDWLYGLHPQLG